MVADKLNQQKRQHRERSQPVNRAKQGLLEKHADYVKRARDFHSKEDRIKKLREKAAGKNKDEFYFGMIKSKTQKGVHVQSRGNEAMSLDLVKVLKTQDVGYIRTQKSVEQAKINRLQLQLDTLLENPTASTSAKKMEEFDEDDFDMMDMMDFEEESNVNIRKHVIFSDDLNAVRTTTDPSSLLPPKSSKLSNLLTALKKSKKSKGKGKAIEIDPALLVLEESQRSEAASAFRIKLTTELDARKIRLASILQALKELENQRLLMTNGARSSIISKKGAKTATDMEQWNDGNGGKSFDDAPEAENGLATGARVWKWKADRKK